MGSETSTENLAVKVPVHLNVAWTTRNRVIGARFGGGMTVLQMSYWAYTSGSVTERAMTW